MRRKQLQANTATEALIMGQARLLAQELERTCNQAPDGHVLDQAEGVILKQGREFLRRRYKRHEANWREDTM
jgi:hypothetical protein